MSLDCTMIPITDKSRTFLQKEIKANVSVGKGMHTVKARVHNRGNWVP